ncbi:MAG: T9SS type A sorting domain-containing protein, partial [Candidatus Hydrothermae bacterium]|nr:T9SS type A sorting domain-containing protein [Candidatus Hydrothermae bacterium]
NVEEYSLELTGVEGLVGAELVYQYDPRKLHLVAVEKGDLLNGLSNSFLVYENGEGKLRINVAVFGEPLSGSGSLVVLKFAKLTAAEAQPVLHEIDLRDYRNRHMLNNADQHTLSGEALSNSFVLFGAVPNPMVSSSKIFYQVPAEVPVRITLYNASGRKVRSLVNKRVKAGNHSVSFDRRDDTGRLLPSGTYFIRMESDGYSAVKKLLVR